MPAVFIQARNGTVSIIRDLTQKEAEKAVDIALDGPRLRAEAAEDHKRAKHQAWIMGLYFGGNPRVEQISFNDRNGRTIIRRNGDWSSCGGGWRWRTCEGGDVIRAEII